MKNKGAIRIITYIVIAIALSTSAFADVNMTDETDGISPKAFGRINHTVSPYTLAVGNSFNLEAGETVEFNCVYTPRTEEIEFGLIVPDGTFRYDAKTNKLVKIGSSDLRKAVSGRNQFIQTAPIVLVIASDTELQGGNMALCGIDAGTVVQNSYLYCAANGLGTVCCYAGENTADVQKFLGIKSGIKPLVYMPVGY